MLYRSLLRRLLFYLPPETAHELALQFLANAPGLTKLAFGVEPNEKPSELERFGLKFSHPVGLAAGFDKDGIALQGLAALGFSFIEAGTVTLHQQPGNERPRLFRLAKDQALINRAGFNNKGAAAFVEQVATQSRESRNYVLGVSIGKSKVAPLEEAVGDYLKSFEIVHPVADYIAVNVSSPNTPGLRELQQAEQLENLLVALTTRNQALSKGKRLNRNLPLLLKISPDVSVAELEAIAAIAQRTGVSGIIATNTTLGRTGLKSSTDEIEACGNGGLSGLPIRALSNKTIAKLYQLTAGAIPLIGVGGIFTAEDAWEKICAGSSLIQLYTGFIYQGPGIVADITEGLERIMNRKGVRSLDDAVGCRAAEIAVAG
ncbi:MAG TPA: quinone-dependent dihydroorotate dehydrogenase [Pyrinomonadaceae bacterium]|nr:quinone-dependent dihydroorotate dehydrogenase [Pyrinomonadaceae bacterium]